MHAAGLSSGWVSWHAGASRSTSPSWWRTASSVRCPPPSFP